MSVYRLITSLTLPFTVCLVLTNSLPSFKKRLKTHYFFLAFKELESYLEFTWWITIRASDSHFGVTLRAL